jgi:hypothetical protein
MFTNNFLNNKSNTTKNQFIASFSVNILTLAHGCALGWVSPVVPYLTSTETHLKDGPLTADAISWIGNNFFFSNMTDFFILS